MQSQKRGKGNRMDGYRCAWCRDEGIMQKYHDEEWGLAVHDDHRHFEYLMMEVMQCGLNWHMMLKKREIFRQCFEDFDYRKIACFGEADVSKIIETPGMIRSVRKINAVIGNAVAFLKILEEYGSFDDYIWGFTSRKTLVYSSHQQAGVTRNVLSDRISADLKKRGFKYLGSITVYSHLQACGIINDHEEHCFLYSQINSSSPVAFLESDDDTPYCLP